MTGQVVLIITHWFDPSADCVVEELNDRNVAVLRFDTADFPRDLCVTGRLDGSGWSGALRVGKRCVAIDAIGGIYFRRPTEFRFGELPEPVTRWAHAEA